MRVVIDHRTVRRGWVLKKTFYEVSTQVHFTHEETQIIRQRALAPTKLVDRRPATARVDDRDEQFALRLNDLLNGKVDRFLCATPSNAKIYEEDILEAMHMVKRWLDDNAETGDRTVVEL